jgi:hypothetical protein
MINRQSRLIQAAKSVVAFVRQLKNPPWRVTEAATRIEAAIARTEASEQSPSWLDPKQHTILTAGPSNLGP